MTTVPDKKIARNHDDILEEIAKSLDIPDTKYEEAKSRYEAIGNWLRRPESTLVLYEPDIFPQGSFLLGTITRPLRKAEEYDLDLVCSLKASKLEFSQKVIKEIVGFEILKYAQANNISNPVKEGRRCWTLNYAESAQFHMDILPSLPDAQKYQSTLNQKGYSNLASNHSLSGQAIAITDKTLPQYSEITDDWPVSNPLGYAAWFRSRMLFQLEKQKREFAKRKNITASIESIPDYKIKTPLQRAIQLLKRHRDCMFAPDSEHKPISIIITTLASHAYNEEATISEALQAILKTMHLFIEERGNETWVANPVNPTENFADKWAEHPNKKRNFYSWLEQAQNDFGLYLRASPFNEIPDGLQKRLGSDLVNRILNSFTSSSIKKITAPAILTSQNLARAEAEINETQTKGTASQPWSQR